MKIFKNNSLGFAHHALLGVVVVAITALAGIKVLTATHALEASGGCRASAPDATITPNEDTAFANKQDYVTIDVAVPKCKQALALEWYRNGHWLTAGANIHNATAANGWKDHFIFNWKISHVRAGSYHWTAKIHNRQGAFYPVNNQGNRYTDLLVIGNGKLGDDKFIKPDNNAVWKRCDQTNFLRVEVVKHWNDGYGSEPGDPKGVEFVNTSVGKPIHYKLTEPTHRGSQEPDPGGNYPIPVFANYWLRKLDYDYYPVGHGCLEKGAYDWVARVIDYNGDGAHLAQEHSDDGVYHLNMTVQ